MSIVRKITRTWRDEGAASALNKVIAGIVAPVFFQRTYRVYRIQLPETDEELLEESGQFRLSILGPDDSEIQRQMAEQVEWFDGLTCDQLESDRHCVIATDGNRLAGFNIISLGNVEIPAVGLSRQFRKHEAWSDNIYVNKEYRGQGLAVALRTRVFQELRRLGIRKLYGGTVPSNTASLRLAEKAGFTQFANIHYRKLMQQQSWCVRRYRGCASPTD